MLHLIGFAPQHHELLERISTLVGADDEVVLLDDGLAFARDTATLAALEKALGVPVYCCSDTPQPGNHIDYDALVRLTEKHQASLSWYE